MPVIVRIWYCWLMQCNVINNCHIMAAANINQYRPSFERGQIRSVVTMTTRTIAELQFYNIFYRLYKYMGVIGSNLGHHNMRLLIYIISLFISVKDLIFVVLVWRAISDFLPCSSDTFKQSPATCLNIDLRPAQWALGRIDLWPVALAIGLWPRANTTGLRAILPWPNMTDLRPISRQY